jgi:hypothetical protein
MFKTFRVKVLTPFLAEQRESYSDIEGINADYSGWFDGAEKEITSRVSSLADVLQWGRLAGVQAPKFMAR